jgi:hypothetical protein
VCVAAVAYPFPLTPSQGLVAGLRLPTFQLALDLREACLSSALAILTPASVKNASTVVPHTDSYPVWCGFWQCALVCMHECVCVFAEGEGVGLAALLALYHTPEVLYVKCRGLPVRVIPPPSQVLHVMPVLVEPCAHNAEVL